MGSVTKTAGEELWRHDSPESTPMYGFMQTVNKKYGLQLRDYPDLYRWSVDNVAAFWEECWHFVGIKSSKPFDQVRDSSFFPVSYTPVLSVVVR